MEGQGKSLERLDTVAWVKGVKESGSVSPAVHVSLGVAVSAVRPVGFSALGWSSGYLIHRSSSSNGSSVWSKAVVVVVECDGCVVKSKHPAGSGEISQPGAAGVPIVTKWPLKLRSCMEVSYPFPAFAALCLREQSGFSLKARLANPTSMR